MTVRFIVGASEGGSYDTFTRLVAATAGHYFPEDTKIDVENISGTAGYGALRVVLDSEPDGLTVGIVSSRWFQRQAIVGDIPNFDLDEVLILGSPSFKVDGYTYCVDRSVATSWQEVLDLGRPLRVGTYEPGTEPPIELMEANGGPFRVIYGFPGTTDIMEAFDRRELDLTSRCEPDTVRALYPWWIEQGRLVPLFYSKEPVDRDYLARLGHTGDLPSFTELPGLGLDEAQQSRMEALEAYLLLMDVRRVFILPAGLPDGIRQYWQELFDLVMKDQRFIDSLSDAGRGDSYGYGTSERLLGIIHRVKSLDQDVKGFLHGVSGMGALDRFIQ